MEAVAIYPDEGTGELDKVVPRGVNCELAATCGLLRVKIGSELVPEDHPGMPCAASPGEQCFDKVCNDKGECQDS